MVPTKEEAKPEPLPGIDYDFEVDDASLPSSYLKLRKMTGLQAVKRAMRDVISQVALSEARKEHGLPDVGSPLHLVFTGNPDTGKTVVAWLVADT